jgi:cell division protein FtsL
MRECRLIQRPGVFFIISHPRILQQRYAHFIAFGKVFYNMIATPVVAIGVKYLFLGPF